MLQARELWGEPGAAWCEWWLRRRDEHDPSATPAALQDVGYRYYFPWLLRHSGAAQLVRERFGQYASRAQGAGLSPQDFRLTAYEEALDMADWTVAWFVEHFLSQGDASAEAWHRVLGVAGEHARFEFETLWMYGVRLRSLGCERPFWVMAVAECGPPAAELSRRYGEELLTTFRRTDQRVRERCGQSLGYCLGLWFILLEFVEETVAEPAPNLHDLPLLNRVLRYPGWAMWPGCREPLPV